MGYGPGSCAIRGIMVGAHGQLRPTLVTGIGTTSGLRLFDGTHVMGLRQRAACHRQCSFHTADTGSLAPAFMPVDIRRPQTRVGTG